MTFDEMMASAAFAETAEGVQRKLLDKARGMVLAYISSLLEAQREACTKRVALDDEHCDKGHFHDSEELAEWLQKAECNVSTTPLVEIR